MAKNDPSAFTPETWQQFEKYKEALAAAAEDTGKLQKDVGGLLDVLASAGPKAEEFTKLFKGSAPGAIATVGVEAIKLYFDWVEKAQAKQHQMILELQAFNQFQREVIKAGGDLYENARKTAETIAGAEAKIHSLSQQLESFENISKIMDVARSDGLQGQTDVRRGEHKASLANIKLLEAMGEISPEQAEQMQIEADRKENVASIQDRVIKAESDYNSASSDYNLELTKVGGKAAFSPQAIGAATDALNDAQGKYNQALILAGPRGQAQLDEMDREIKVNKDQSKNHGTEWNVGTREIKDIEFWNQNQELLKQRAQLAKEIKDAQDHLGAYRNAVASAQQHLDDLTGLVEKFAKLETQLGELNQKKLDEKDAAPKLTATANEEASAASLAAQIKSGHLNRGDFLKAIVGDVYGIEASHILSGKNFDQTQAQTLAALLQLLEKVHLNSVSVLQVITDGLRKKETLEQVLEEVGAQIAAAQNNHGSG